MPDQPSRYVPVDTPENLDELGRPEVTWEGAHPIRAWWRRRKERRAQARAAAASASGGATHR
jgi:hypothetical protein